MMGSWLLVLVAALLSSSSVVHAALFDGNAILNKHNAEKSGWGLTAAQLYAWGTALDLLTL